MKTISIEEEVEKILNSKKYRHIHPATVKDVLESELAKSGNQKQLLENARVKLHQVWAGYLGFPQIQKAKEKFSSAFENGNNDTVKSVCLEILETHMSTKERIPILDEFYSFIFGHCKNPKIILDLASALNPFSIPWMKLESDTKYIAYDINSQYVDFLNFFFSYINKNYSSEFTDIYVNPPDVNGDIAFLFKMYHCLEKRKRGAGMAVLKSIKSRWIAVTFPTRSLANRLADIAGNYEDEIYQYAESRGWKIIREKFETEDLMLIECSEF